MEIIDTLCIPSYRDDGLVLVNDMRTIDFDRLKRKVPDVAILGLVRAGFMHVEIEGKSEYVGGGQIFFCGSHMSIAHPSYGEEFQGHALLFSVRFGQQIITTTGNIWRYLTQLSANPVITLPEDTVSLLKQYYNILSVEVLRRGNMYYHEIVPSIIRNMLYSLINDVRQSSIFDPMEIKDLAGGYDGSPQSLALFNRFIDILATERCTHRNLSYYASRLYVTPKYLSTVCRKISGRTARQWVCDTIINGIETHLRYSDKSIKEISVIYGFPNMSVFSKFVKTHLGIAPMKYRK